MRALKLRRAEGPVATAVRADRALSPTEAERFGREATAVVQRVGEIVLGKEGPIRLAVACMLARGHVLIEDVPGVGKTTLAHVLAGALGLSFHRVQFTSDLLPADILGVSVYDQAKARFEFHPGPIFTHVVLADEVNRATPKSQSALLEAMEEHQVTQDGETRQLPEPFFVVATQNPSHQIGTFPLPESQLDRFLMRIELGYPDEAAERALLTGRDRRELIEHLQPVTDITTFLAMQRAVPDVHASEALLDYVQAVLSFTRNAPEYALGLSPRGGVALLRAAQAWALMAAREHVVPEDIQAVLPAVVGHRLRVANQPHDLSALGPRALGERLLEQVPIP